jgi:hypothetical protein
MNYDVSLQSIAWLNGRRNDNSLEISPKFQRRPVWMESERSSLISTICAALPFPEIYIQLVTNPADGAEQHIVVDGQQRVTSILMFIDGELALPENDDWNGEYFRDFDDAQKEAFWNYKVVVRGLSQTNDAEIRDLFTRLNTNNIALNDQELRNARYRGRFKLTAERLADNPLFQTIGLFTPRDIRRMLDVEFASELLLLTVEGVTNKKDLVDDAYANFEEEFPQEAEYENDFDSAIALLRSLITEDNKTPAKTKSNFYSLYGACLRYYREARRAAFRNSDGVAAALTDLLVSVRANDLEGKPQTYAEYFEAVTRAASDKGRRVAREQILFDLIKAAEEPTPPVAPVQQQANAAPLE